MATTITPVAGSATPYSKKFVLVGDGTEGIFSLADFATHLAEGPLKQAIARRPAANIADFNLDGAHGEEIRIYNVAATATDATVARDGARRIRWVSNVGLSCTLAAQKSLVIEVRLNHSVQA